MDGLSKKGARAHSLGAGAAGVLAGLVWLAVHVVRETWVPEFVRCFKLLAVSVMLLSATWIGLAWLTYLVDRHVGDDT